MKRKTYLIISSVAITIIFIAAFAGIALMRLAQYEEHKDTIFLCIKLLIIPLIGVGIFGFIFNRCPSCSRYLQQIPFFARNCPFCGSKLDGE